MLRVTLRKDRHAFEARLASGKPIQEHNFEKFAWFVSRQILQWATDMDDEPFEEISFPTVVAPPSDTYWLARLLVHWMEFEPTNRWPEVVRELLPELGSVKTLEPIAAAPNFNACLCLLMDQIAQSKNKAKRLKTTARSEIAKKSAANAAKRLSAVESRLMDFLADIGTKQSPIKAVEMSERESIMWDNDPHAGQRTDAETAMYRDMVYGNMLDRGVQPDSDEAADSSKDFTLSYADWLSEQCILTDKRFPRNES